MRRRRDSFTRESYVASRVTRVSLATPRAHQRINRAKTAAAVPYVDLCQETAYGTTVRLPFQIRVF